jgi:hypothetical protein
VGRARATLDILIHTQRQKALVAVENKIDDRLKQLQLGKYSRIKEVKCCDKYCFVKHYYPASTTTADWDLRYWGDFYLHLAPLIGTDIVTDNFITVLEDFGMVKPHKITGSNLKALATALHRVRFDGEPEFTYKTPSFETLAILKTFLEDLFKRAAEDTVLRKRAKKKFRPSMYVSYWWEDEKKKRTTQWLWIGCESKLAKPYKGVTSFSAALLLTDKPEKYSLVAYFTNLEGHFREPMLEYKRKDIDCLEFQKEAMGYWTKFLK